jgi:hypothetical protein
MPQFIVKNDQYQFEKRGTEYYQSLWEGGRPVREVVIHCMGSMLEPSRKKIELGGT